jgi:hypothetical protein
MTLYPEDHQRAVAYQAEALRDFASLTREQ